METYLPMHCSTECAFLKASAHHNVLVQLIKSCTTAKIQGRASSALQQAEDAEAAPPGAAVEVPDLASVLQGLEEKDSHAAGGDALEQAAEASNGGAKEALLALPAPEPGVRMCRWFVRLMIPHACALASCWR